MIIRTPGRYKLREPLTVKTDEGMHSVVRGDLITVVSIDSNRGLVFLARHGWVDWDIPAVRDHGK